MLGMLVLENTEFGNSRARSMLDFLMLVASLVLLHKELLFKCPVTQLFSQKRQKKGKCCIGCCQEEKLVVGHFSHGR